MDRTPYGVAPRSRFSGWRPTPGSAALMALVAGAWLLLFEVMGAPSWVGHLALVPERALGREPWQLGTSLFVHPDLRALLFNLLGIWFFGSMVEMRAGRRRMIGVFAAGQIGGALVAAALGCALSPSVPVAAYSLGTSALLGAITVLFWSTPLSVFGAPSLSGRMVAVVLIALGTLPLLWRGAWVELAGTLGALGTGALAAETGAVEGLRRRWRRFRFWRIRRRYKVISGGRDRRGYLH